jgi:hypothetical protein
MSKIHIVQEASLFLLAAISVLCIVLFVYVMMDVKNSSTAVIVISSILGVGALAFVAYMGYETAIHGPTALSYVKTSMSALTTNVKGRYENAKKRAAELNEKIQKKINDPLGYKGDINALKAELANVNSQLESLKNSAESS